MQLSLKLLLESQVIWLWPVSRFVYLISEARKVLQRCYLMSLLHLHSVHLKQLVEYPVK